MYFQGSHCVLGTAVHAMVIYYGGPRPIQLSKDYSPGERDGIIKPRGKWVKVSTLQHWLHLLPSQQSCKDYLARLVSREK